MHVNSANDDGDPEDARRQRQGTHLAAEESCGSMAAVAEAT